MRAPSRRLASVNIYSSMILCVMFLEHSKQMPLQDRALPDASRDLDLKYSQNCSDALSPLQVTAGANLFKEISGNDTVRRHQEIDTNSLYSTLCWVEITNLLERKDGTRRVDREFAMVLESPADIPEMYLEEKAKGDVAGASQYEIIDEDTKKSRVVNFTTIGEDENGTRKQNRKLLCASGPVLAKDYQVWSSSGRKRVEIKVGSRKRGLKAIPRCKVANDNVDNLTSRSQAPQGDYEDGTGTEDGNRSQLPFVTPLQTADSSTQFVANENNNTEASTAAEGHGNKDDEHEGRNPKLDTHISHMLELAGENDTDQTVTPYWDKSTMKPISSIDGHLNFDITTTKPPVEPYSNFSNAGEPSTRELNVSITTAASTVPTKFGTKEENITYTQKGEVDANQESIKLCYRNAKHKLLITAKVLLAHQIVKEGTEEVLNTVPLFGVEKTDGFDLGEVKNTLKNFPENGTINEKLEELIEMVSRLYMENPGALKAQNGDGNKHFEGKGNWVEELKRSLKACQENQGAIDGKSTVQQSTTPQGEENEDNSADLSVLRFLPLPINSSPPKTRESLIEKNQQQEPADKETKTVPGNRSEPKTAEKEPVAFRATGISENPENASETKSTITEEGTNTILQEQMLSALLKKLNAVLQERFSHESD